MGLKPHKEDVGQTLGTYGFGPGCYFVLPILGPTTVRDSIGKIADTLNADTVLNDLIAQQSVDDATITIDPTSKGVRIYGKWKNSFEFNVSKVQFEIFDKIAGHIKSF